MNTRTSGRQICCASVVEIGQHLLLAAFEKTRRDPFVPEAQTFVVQLAAYNA